MAKAVLVLTPLLKPFLRCLRANELYRLLKNLPSGFETSGFEKRSFWSQSEFVLSAVYYINFIS